MLKNWDISFLPHALLKKLGKKGFIDKQVQKIQQLLSYNYHQSINHIVRLVFYCWPSHWILFQNKMSTEKEFHSEKYHTTQVSRNVLFNRRQKYHTTQVNWDVLFKRRQKYHMTQVNRDVLFKRRKKYHMTQVNCDVLFKRRQKYHTTRVNWDVLFKGTQKIILVICCNHIFMQEKLGNHILLKPSICRKDGF